MTDNERYGLSVISHKLEAGYTLVELIVAMGVFLVAVTLAVGVFVQALKTQRIINDLMAVNSNASIVLESMAREIRTGYNFSGGNFSSSICQQNSQYDVLNFTNFHANAVTYELQSGALVRRECNLTVCTGKNFATSTASNVSVNHLCFSLNSSTQSPRTDPWRITAFLTVGSQNPNAAGNTLNLQTTIASRILPSEVPSP